jgi:hypothetical protein
VVSSFGAQRERGLDFSTVGDRMNNVLSMIPDPNRKNFLIVPVVLPHQPLRLGPSPGRLLGHR